jgi:tetratricopeptide (TPR) repeat protein/tRNA A-37 threonylcarbamoyl transferase component Bud32
VSGSVADGVSPGMDSNAAASSDRFARVRAAFHRLVETDLSKRAEALQALAETDPVVAAELRELFGQLDETDLLATPEKAPPSRLGPFRMLHRIGRGGMGEVFLAERVEGGFEQQVALKLVREAALSPELARRFVRERQILARLQHPNIAHLVDGGVGPDERPWLAMEYVPGERITQWCATRALGPAACVRLFLPVCDAVQFAHRNLIVHRDLKPANILVDAEGRPRLLDFGVARLLDAQDAEQTRNVAALTPAYAAPEQREGGEITTATDIYQLGVVLRELVSTPRNDASARALRGDLGRILDKATAPTPSDRYAGVAMFADDLADWLQRMPLRSGIGSRRERLRKTLWQWRWPLAMLVVVLVAVGTGALLALQQAREKAREADVAQQTTQFLIGLFRGADPAVARGAALTAQDLLDQGTARLHGVTRLAPEVRARLLHTVAETYTALGHYERALAPAEEALAARRGEDASIDGAESLDQVGNILRLQAELVRAEPLLREALDQRRALLPNDDPATIESIAHLAALESAKGRFKEANVLFAEAVEAARRRFGDESAETAHYLDSHAGNLDDMGLRNEALPLYRRALAIRERILGPDDAEVATTLVSLGVHLAGSGRYDEAAALLQRALAIRATIYGAAHPLVAYARIALAGVYADQARLDEAEQLVQQALASLRTGLLSDHPKVSEALNMLALIRIMRRDYGGAIPLQEEVLARYAATVGEGHPDALTAKNNLAYALMRAGRATEAERLLRDVLARRRDDNGQAEAHAHQNLASALVLQGKFAEAVDAQRRAVRLQVEREGATSAATAIALRELAIAEEFAGLGTEPSFRSALAMAEEVGRSQDLALHGWSVPLAAFLVGTDRCAEAAPLLRDALEAMDAGDDAGDPISRPQVQLLLGACEATNSAGGSLAIEPACRELASIPGAEADLYPTPRKLLRTRCAAAPAP